ncbi:bifunctional adenosylcobinamide kinase/adenosylcobinamide-phosphate guanylyltransferase [Anaerotalea alkaliphila]|uniref:Adenosylcobinamide kinase n=1 Tax=Anaerotalea alkaliphila TaxID=2662126 RepID=A0A7X5HX93_9FIRM|nr:bifunctional adenosylcobinamide kinase/adenosylcobinamide-phosphate guanylyltransferase [Anaerotalea alkaliphila]NDL68353.1 adenosylcobinamide kinase [Anaerotalea alkaliphila]
MFILIAGGAASGKSELAEGICQKLCGGTKLYIATMDIPDHESELRVWRHREMRKGKDFDTLESPLCDRVDWEQVSLYGTVLLECMSNLLANEMFIGKKTSENATDDIIDYIRKLKRSVSNMIVVSNDVFGDMAGLDSFTVSYSKAIAEININLAEEADAVIESVYGIPVFRKGDVI